MTGLRQGILFPLLVLVAVLAGCGNDPGGGTGTQLIGSILKGNGQNDTPKTTPASIDPAGLVPIALRAVKGPVMLAVVESRNAIAIMGRSARNGPYSTWITASRQTVTLKHGIVTATRGLGDDLMNADVDSVASLIRTRHAGTGWRAMYFLDGEGKTYRLDLQCTVIPGPAQPLTIGKLRIASRRVDETCHAGNLTVENTYWTDSAGRIWQARQWVSPGVGYLVTQQLRR